MSERDFHDLYAGTINTVGTGSLAVSPATTTVITHPGVSSTSTVILTPTNAAMGAATGVWVQPGVPDKGQFTVNHPSSASARTFAYAFFTPRQR